MIKSLIENGYKVDVIISNISERGISSSDIKKRLENIYKGVSFFVRKHPSLLNKSKKGTKERRQFYIHKAYTYFDLLTFSNFRVHNYSLMPFNVRKIFKNKLRNEKYDAVYCNYLYNVPNFLKKMDCEIISDIHDLQYRRIENDVIPTVNSLKSFLYKLFYKSSELKRLKLVDKIISISPIETKLIKNIFPNKEIFTIPATADIPNSLSFIEQKYDISFIGSNSDANRDSLLWFLNNCFESLVETNKNIKFLIQGRIVRNKLIKENKIFSKYLRKNIIPSDYIEVLSDVYNDTKIIICPIIKGSGMKIKVIEGLSYGKAIVGTDIAFEGINVINKMNGLVANQSIEFVDSINLLLNDDLGRENLEKESFKLFKNEHSLNFCIKSIKKVIK